LRILLILVIRGPIFCDEGRCEKQMDPLSGLVI
jgi:hypothetical protein